MKASVNWLKEYTDIDISASELTAKIGAQLGAVEEVIDLGEKYQGIIIAKVISCEKHPNADKLSLCKIDDGGAAKDAARDENGHIQVVCGAPNIREGLLVAWLPPGTTVPATADKDPLVLEAREIRGEASNGMLASPSELALSDDHSGILELPEGMPGEDFAEKFGLDDYIIDIENKMFTHRPDLFGILGIAREIAGIQQKPFVSPDWYVQNPEFPGIEAEELKLTVKNELTKLVPRFSAITMSNITVRPSPLWLQILLSKLGMKPINNIVDYTNYFMYLTAQPLHAYDYDKVKERSESGAAMVIRKPHKGEKIKLLNGKEIEPRSEAIMIATDKEAIGIGGVMGGSDTEVDEHTANIILECANFDMYSIRRTAMEHGLFTDAVTRFTKGQSPLQNGAVLAKIVQEIRDNAGGKVASKFNDNHEKEFGEPSVQHIEPDFINKRLGLDLDIGEMQNLLENVEFRVSVGEDLEVGNPFWRTDIEIAEDIVEEIGRLQGYDYLPLDLPKRMIMPVRTNDLLALKHQLRSTLAKAGANEALTYSFVHGNLFDKAGQDKKQAFKIANALSPDLQYYRLSLTPSLLDKVHLNVKAGYDEFALFEIGKVHGKSEFADDKLPKELERVALVYANKSIAGDAAYYKAQKLMGSLLYQKFAGMRLVPLAGSEPINHVMFTQMIAPYDPARSALVYDFEKLLGVIGEFKPPVRSKLKLPVRTAGFELFLQPMLKPRLDSYSPLSRYPSTDQDISLRTDRNIPFADILNALDTALRSSSPEDIEFNTRCIDIFSNDETAKHTTFRITVFSRQRTLTTQIVTSLLAETASKLKQAIDAERI